MNNFHFNKLIWVILVSFFYIEKIAISKNPDPSIEPTVKTVLSKEDKLKPIENIIVELLDSTVRNYLKLKLKNYIVFLEDLWVECKYCNL